MININAFTCIKLSQDLLATIEGDSSSKKNYRRRQAQKENKRATGGPFHIHTPVENIS